MGRKRYVERKSWAEQKDYDEFYGKSSKGQFLERYTQSPNGSWKLTSFGCTKRYDGGNLFRDNELNNY